MDADPLPMVQPKLEPPFWRLPLQNHVDFGYPDYTPARPGHSQKEDILNASTIRNGYQGSTGNPNISALAGAGGAGGAGQVGGGVIAPGAETACLHQAIYERLKKDNFINNINSLADEIIAIKEEAVKEEMPPWSFKLPSRVVYNHTMRQSFLHSLSDPTIPLSRLSRSIPHGIKGMEMLELIWGKGVGVERGVWLVMVVGGVEIQAMKNKPQPLSAAASASTPNPNNNNHLSSSSPTTPPYTPTPSDIYTADFTKTFMAFCKKHLGEFEGMRGLVKNAVAGGAGGGVGGGMERGEWVGKWKYILDLAKQLSERELLDGYQISKSLSSLILPPSETTTQTPSHTAFQYPVLKFYLELSMATLISWLPQGPVSRREMQEGYMTMKRFKEEKKLVGARRVIRGFVGRLGQMRLKMRGEGGGDGLDGRGRGWRLITDGIEGLVQIAWRADPETFFSPIMWLHNERELRELIIPPGVEVSRETSKAFEDLKARTDYLLVNVKVPVDVEKGGEEVEVEEPEQQIFDNFTKDSDIRQFALQLFGVNPFVDNNKSRTRAKVHALLDWAFHRTPVKREASIIAACAIKHMPSDEAHGSARSIKGIIFRWISKTCSTERSIKQRKAISGVLGALIRFEVIAFEDYMLDLVVPRRGGPVEADNILAIFRLLPYYGNDERVLYQRKMILATRLPTDDVESRKAERQADDARRIVEGAFRGNSLINAHDCDLGSHVSEFVKSRLWVESQPAFKQRISNSDRFDVDDLASLLAALDICGVDEARFEVLGRIARVTIGIDTYVYTFALAALRRSATIWTVIGLTAEAQVIEQKLQQCRQEATAAAGTQLPQQRALIPEARLSVAELEGTLREISDVHRQSNEASVDRVAGKVVRHASNNARVLHKVWDRAMSGLAHIDITLIHPEGQRTAITMTVRFLQQIALHNPVAIEHAFIAWCSNALRGGHDALSEQVCELLLDLAARAVIPVATIMHSLLFPAWKSLASLSAALFDGSLDTSSFLALSAGILAPELSIEGGADLSFTARQSLSSESFLALSDPAQARRLLEVIPFAVVLACRSDLAKRWAQLLDHLVRVGAVTRRGSAHLNDLRRALAEPAFSLEGLDDVRDELNSLQLVLDEQTTESESSFPTLLQQWKSSRRNGKAAARAAIRRHLTAAVEAGDPVSVMPDLIASMAESDRISDVIDLFSDCGEAVFVSLSASTCKILASRVVSKGIDQISVGDGCSDIKQVVLSLAATLAQLGQHAVPLHDSSKLELNTTLSAASRLLLDSEPAATKNRTSSDPYLLLLLFVVRLQVHTRTMKGDTAAQLASRLPDMDGLVYGLELFDGTTDEQLWTLLSGRLAETPSRALSPNANEMIKKVDFSAGFTVPDPWDRISGLSDISQTTALTNSTYINTSLLHPLRLASSNSSVFDANTAMKRPASERDGYHIGLDMSLFTRANMLDLVANHDLDAESEGLSLDAQSSHTPAGRPENPITIDDDDDHHDTQADKTASGNRRKSLKRPREPDSPSSKGSSAFNKRTDRKPNNNNQRGAGSGPRRKSSVRQ